MKVRGYFVQVKLMRNTNITFYDMSTALFFDHLQQPNHS